MKKIQLVLLISFFIISHAGAQFTDTIKPVSPKLHSDQLFQKARNQKTAAWVFLGAGAGLAIAGAIIETNAVEKDPLGALENLGTVGAGGIMVIAGGASMLASVPFFIASGKNRRKAIVSLNNESNSILHQLHKGNIIRVGISLNL